MGGRDPPTSLSQAVFPPKRGGAHGPWAGANLCTVKLEQGHALWGKTQRATPSGGVFPSNPPQDGPPDLGIARICWGVFTSRYSTDFHRFIWTFLGDYS